MKKVGIFVADGCEEIEALTVVDIIRRAQLEITTISITDKKEVTSSHNITFFADAIGSEVDFDGYDAIVLPGGMPGTLNLMDSELVNQVIKKFQAEGKIVAAICAAFSLALLDCLTDYDEEVAAQVKKGIVYRNFEE